MTRRRRILVVVATIGGLFALYEVATSFVAYTADAYVQSDLVALAPQVTGRIVAIQVKDNQSAAQGDLLASIDPVPYQLAVDQKQAELDEARAQVVVDQDMAATARDIFAAATSAAAYSHDTQTRMAALANTQDISRADLDQANDALRRADATVDAAWEAIARAQANAAMHQAAQIRAAAALATAEWQLARLHMGADARVLILP